MNRCNVADRLAAVACQIPDELAVVCPWDFSPDSRFQQQTFGLPEERPRTYAIRSFAELDSDVSQIGRGLIELGVTPGMRLALLVKPSLEFVTLVFALLRSGATVILIDSGMSKRHLVRCLSEAKPAGFVAIPQAQIVRSILRHKFPNAKLNITVGKKWFWRGLTLDQVQQIGIRSEVSFPQTKAEDPAAIIFTSGSTGPPKGVLYRHQTFETQVSEIQRQYSIPFGRIDLSCFPLFGLFNSAMGVTTILPEMDAARPAAASPQKLLAAANDWKADQAFASPAVWKNLASYCQESKQTIPTLQHIFSCGAPVPSTTLRETLACVHPQAVMHTPYGATESLPVATIEAAEVLAETAQKTEAGAGICLGRKFQTVRWKVIKIRDKAIPTLAQTEDVETGILGELIVSGPQISHQYVTRTEWNTHAKIIEEETGTVWHRIGDVGYLDSKDPAEQRFWYCGRKSQRVETRGGPMFTIPCEAIFSTHPDIARAALVGLGEKKQTPAIIIEPTAAAKTRLLQGATSAPTASFLKELQRLVSQHDMLTPIQHFFIHPRLPVDVRHNAKIFREQLTDWAAEEVKRSGISVTG